MSIEVDGGRFQARVAVIALDGTRTRSQRFVDLEEYAGKAEADAHAIEGGKAWVDSQMQKEQLMGRTHFTPS
jgi:hypothetical protein